MPEDLKDVQKKVEELEKSVQKLHNIAWVIGVVAAVFGVGGAFGFSAFSKAGEKLLALEENIGHVDERVASAVKQREAEAALRLKETATTLLDGLAKWGTASPQGEAEKDVVFRGQSGRSDVKYCPDGQYVVGLQVIDEDGGRFCVSCINGVRFICRPLKRS